MAEKKEEVKKEKVSLGATSCGMKAELAAALSYVLGFVSGIVFFIIEKKNEFVRFHAMQSIILFASLFVLGTIFSLTPLVGWIIWRLIFLGAFILWIILLIKASQGEYFELPWIGKIARENAKIKK